MSQKSRVNLPLTDEYRAEREINVLRARFILPNYSLEQVGAMLGWTRERVRQIEASAIAKLRGRYQDTATPAKELVRRYLHEIGKDQPLEAPK